MQKKALKPHLCLGQTVSEYTLVIALVVSAIVAMQIYVQRGLQARYHDVSQSLIKTVRDTAGNQSLPAQYEPYYTKSKSQIQQQSSTAEDFYAPAVVVRRTNEFSRREVNQGVLPSLCAAGNCIDLSEVDLCPVCQNVRCCPPKVCVAGKVCR